MHNDRKNNLNFLNNNKFRFLFKHSFLRRLFLNHKNSFLKVDHFNFKLFRKIVRKRKIKNKLIRKSNLNF